MVPTSPQNSIRVCQSRPLRARREGLDREHDADATITDCSQQPLETRTGDASARSSEIVVDDLDGRPAKLPGAVGKPVLSALALEVVHQLIGG